MVDNDTEVYWDSLDGPNLACNPTNIAEGYEIPCFYLTKVVSTIMLVCGVWMLYLAYVQRKMVLDNPASSRKKAPTKPTILSTSDPKQQAKQHQKPLSANGGEKSDSKLTKYSTKHGIKVASVLGWCMIFAGLGWHFGNGTMYPTSEMRGVVGDFITGVYISLSWYTSRMQIEGAVWFKSLVTEPKYTANRDMQWRRFKQTVLTICDAAQGPLGPVIALVIWLNVVAGTLPRGLSFFIYYLLNCIYGLRAFAVIATKRVAAVKRVIEMVKAKGGDLEAQRRRAGFVKRKTLALTVDLIGVLLTHVVVPGSLLVAVFSSRQLVVQTSIFLTPVVFVILLVTVSIHVKVMNAKRQKTKIVKAKQVAPGTSVVGDDSQLESSAVADSQM